jgi:tRNA 2-selenouridine synthase
MIPVVLFGPTGSGKTNILKKLSAKGFAVLDLESFAVHRGSVFGRINIESTQPSQFDFENTIARKLDEFYGSRYVFVEHEAGNLGKLRIPGVITEMYKRGVSVLVNTSLAKRVQYTLKSTCLLKTICWFQHLKNLKIDWTMNCFVVCTGY